MREAALVTVLLASACVFPADNPTGIEFSWQFVEVNEADGEEARRLLTCAGAAAERVATHIADVDTPPRQGTFRFECEQGFQTESDATQEASDAFVQLHPGDYDVSLAIETPGEADELLAARTVDVLSRAATLELWQLQREPVTWTLAIAGVDACTEVSVALYYDAPGEALSEAPLDDEGEPTAVLYREMLASDRGLGLAGTPMSCADAAGEHVFADIDRGDFSLEVTVDGFTCPFAFTIGSQTTTSLDLGALPCG